MDKILKSYIDMIHNKLNVVSSFKEDIRVNNRLDSVILALNEIDEALNFSKYFYIDIIEGYNILNDNIEYRLKIKNID